MPVTAHIPIRLRIDPALAGAEIDGAVRAAVAAAVGRSLRAFEEEVVEPRGGYARPAFATPTFVWSGRPVDAAWRQATERACAEEIAALVRPIAEETERRLRDAPPVVPPDPAERIVPTRFKGRTYRVPSYEGETPSPDVALYFESEDTALAFTPPGYHADWWEWDGSDLTKLSNAIANALIMRFRPKRSYPKRAGVVYWDRLKSSLILRFVRDIVATRETDSTTSMTWTWGEQITLGSRDRVTSVRFTEKGLNETTQATGFRPYGNYQLARVATVASAAELEKAMFEWELALFHVPAIANDKEPSEVTRKRIALQEFCSRLAEKNQTMRAIHVLAGSDTHLTFLWPEALPYDENTPIVPLGAFQLGEVPEGDGEGAPATRLGPDEGGEGESGGGSESAGDEAATPDGADGDAAAFVYPVSYGDTQLKIDLGPFMGEPSFDQLGELGTRMRRLMRRIAFRLAMPEGNYCGSFLIAAAQVMGAHASGIADLGETDPAATKAAPAGTGNLGLIDLQPEISPAVRLMRYLGATCPAITELTELMASVYQVPSVKMMITGWRHNDAIGWLLEFHEAHTPAMSQAVSWTYVRTCQMMMLQVLRSSREAIQHRITKFDEYFPVAEALITRLLGREADFMRMRDLLLSVTSYTSPSDTLDRAVSTWRDARQLFTTSLSSQVLNVAEVTSPGRLFDSPGSLEYQDGWKVRDASGRLWSRAEIEREIAMRHQLVQSIDPLIQQFVNIPDVVATFRDSPTLAKAYLFSLLTEMLQNNADIEQRTRSDDFFAFRSGAITESLPDRTVPGTSVIMRGIHLLAHDAIGESFAGDHWYAAGLNEAFNVELGRQGIISFAETAGILILSVLCPPVGFALGVGSALLHYHEASIKEELFGSLLDPQVLMLSRSEIEFEMFMAQFELALSIIPDIGVIMRSGERVMQAGVRGGVRGALTSVRRQMLVSVGRQVRIGLVRAFVETVLVDQALRQILPHLLGPVMAEVEREITIMSGGGVSSVETEDSGGGSEMTPEEVELVGRLLEYQEGERNENRPPASEAP